MVKGESIDFDKIPEADVIVKEAKSRFQKGLYTLIFLTGLPGTGKSSSTTRLAELISESIHNENRIKSTSIVDSFLGFLEKVQEAKENPGLIIPIEEVSVLFPSRRAMQRDNVDMAKVLDTCRKRKVILIANAPLWSAIDGHMRAMGHILIETQYINKTANVVVSKAWKLQTNPFSGKTYRHTFRRENKDVNRIYTRQCNQEVWEEYERNKDNFMEDLYKRIQLRVKQQREKQKKELQKDVKPIIRELTKRELEVHQLVNQNGLTQSDAARRLGLTPQRVQAIVVNIVKKTNMNKKHKFLNNEKPIQTASS